MWFIFVIMTKKLYNSYSFSYSYSRLRIAAKSVIAVERMKRMAGDRLERGENFIDSISLHSTTTSTTTTLGS